MTARRHDLDDRLGPDDGAGPVLNPGLYGRLVGRVARGGTVRVTNPGQAAVFGPTFVDPSTRRRHTVLILKGEHYVLDCPYCGDRRARLCVGYKYMTPDPVTGRPMRGLAHCFNNSCLAVPDHYVDFEQALFGHENASRRAALRDMLAGMTCPGTVAAEAEVGHVPLPGRCVPLDRLPRGHAALAYLEDRGFDPGALARDWGLAYCDEATGLQWQVAGRIIVPILFRGDQVGWQARYVGERDWKATGIRKYLFPRNFAKSRLLYNHDVALGYDVVVVCEGVTDCWTVGPPAVATFGKTISQAQRTLLRAWVERGGVVVLLLDPDVRTDHPRGPAVALAKYEAMVAALAPALGHRLAVVELPAGRDPAQSGRAALWRRIRRACRDQGLPLGKGGGA